MNRHGIILLCKWLERQSPRLRRPNAFANTMSKGKTVEESIRIQAYLLSEKEGHPSGMEGFFWRQAEALVAAKLKAKKSKTKVKAKAKTPVPVEAPKAKASPKAAKAAKPAKPAKSSRKKKDPSPA